jgi:hypothetical protein
MPSKPICNALENAAAYNIERERSIGVRERCGCSQKSIPSVGGDENIA